MSKNEVKLPPCGLYIGSAVYNHSARLICAGEAFTYWSPDGPSARETIDLCLEHHQGNTLQFWQKGEEILDLAKTAADKGLYVLFLSSTAPESVSKHLAELGDHYLGYDFGERFSFHLGGIDGHEAETGKSVTLSDLANNLMKMISVYVADRKKTGWGNIMTTGNKFHMDYEIEAGTDIPLYEEFGQSNLMLTSALSRGLYRAYDLPMWGTHLAHEWYSWMPQANPLKFPTLDASLRLKYLAGAKLIINESGNWAAQSSLCPDAPMHTMPRVILDPPGILLLDKGPELTKQYIDEARKLFCNIDFRSPTAVKYRKSISEFYDFALANPAPAGQPESTVAIAKGKYDLGAAGYAAEIPVANAFELAQNNPDWLSGPPEHGWDIVKSVFFPNPPQLLAPNKNHCLAGSPHGMVDIVSFAGDRITAEFLSKNYKALIFSGWNSASEEQYSMLVDYVKAGGKLCLGIPHLSRDIARNYRNYTVDDLVHGGDFSELCGLRVLGPGDRFYWATGASRTPNAMGLAIPRRYGIMGVPLGKIEITDPDSIEVLAADDEQSRPLIIRRKLGAGEVFFINSWAYPGALNSDNGPGCTVGSRGLMGLLYEYIASISRGHVWITATDGPLPDEDCEHIAYSYFPDAGKICLQNIDFHNARSCVLHQFGDVEPITLAPSEFRIMDSVILKPGEKYNQR